MNNSIRVSAKTVADAITSASIQLGVPSGDLEYEVIEKGSAGFLGIGMKQAVIEVRRKEKDTAKSEEVLKNDKDAPSQKEKVSKKEVEVKKEIAAEEKNEKSDIVKPEIAKTGANETVKEEPVKKISEEETVFVKKEREPVEIQEQTKQAVAVFLKDTLSTMGMEVKLETSVDKDGALCVDMSGDNMGILIGKRGQTLDSLQYLANRVANKHQEGYVRVKLDTEGYRARRQSTLENLAKSIAYKVKKTRTPIALEPMNPYERRIIHAALQGDSRVTTHSEGEEPYRKVVVTLK